MRGPYTKIVKFPGPTGDVQNYRNSRWYRTDLFQQVRKPLPYSVTQTFLVRGTRNANNAWFYDAQSCFIRQYLDLSWGRCNVYGNTIESLHNACYAKWLDKVRSSAQLGTNAAEFRQTLSMIQTTLGALRRPLRTFATAYKRYARGPLKGSNTLILKDAPKAWLTWHFGVEPLVKDLYSLLERLADPGKPTLVSVSKSQTLTYSYARNGQKIQETYKQHVRVAGYVTRMDESLALWTDLGLTNPVSIAWELVPYSFVVDWFFPIGSYLNSVTDLLGYKIQDPYRTWFVTAKGTTTMSYPAVMRTDPCNGVPTLFEGYRLDRSLVSPSLVSQKIRIPMNLSLTRAATQVSLLLQILNKNR